MYTLTPLHLDVTQHILPEDGPAMCKKLLLERKIYSASLIVEALCHALEINEDKLQLDVKAILSIAHSNVAKVIDQ